MVTDKPKDGKNSNFYYWKREGHDKASCQKIACRKRVVLSQPDASRSSNRREQENKHPTFSSFYTLASSSAHDPRALIDTAACTSILGKETFDKMMNSIVIEYLENEVIRRSSNQFRSSSKAFQTLFSSYSCLNARLLTTKLSDLLFNKFLLRDSYHFW